MTSLPKYLVHGNNCNVGRDTVCCFRNPHVCRPGSLHNSSRPSVGLTEPRPLTTAQAQPLRLTAANSTYGCCERSDTFWREPVDDVPPYRRLVQRLLQPFSERISRADVLRATYSTEDGVYRTTCAILRVARGKVCKVRVLGQRLEKTSHKPQEAGLLSLVRKLLPLPDFELAYCPGDGEAIVADAAAASARWNGKSGCTTGVVHNHVALRQFRCQAKAHLPFFFWYRQNVYGELDGWDATTAQLRARAAATPWEGRRPVAFFRGSLNQAMTPETCLRIKPRDRPTRCELLHVANARPGLIDYSVGPNSSQPFVAWARHKYVLFMEGTEEWADRLKLLLQLGSVVLIQELWCNEHYFWLMRPWVHYVPVATRMEDLVATVQWLREHDDVARAIGAAGQAFALEHLQLSSVLSFHRELLLQYARRFDATDKGGWPRGSCPSQGSTAADEPLQRKPISHLKAPTVRYCNRAPR